MSYQHADADLVSIVIFGCTGIGKSTFVNDASQAELGVGHGLAAQTKEIQTSPIFQVGGRNVQLYDTPSFDDSMQTDMQVLKKLAELFEGMHNTGRKINALLYFHRITDIRMTSTSVKSFDFFSKICGLSNMRNVMIVTNMWATPADPEEERRYEQLKTSLFKAALDNGAKMCQRRGIGPESAQAIIQMMVDLPPIELQLQTELAQGFALDETEAGRLVDQDLRATLERQRREREKLEEELRATREDRDRLVQESKQDLKQRVDSLKASRWPSHTTARKRSSTALSSPTLDFPGHGDQSGGRSGGSQKRTLKMFLAGSDQDSSSFDPATGNPPTYQKPSIEYRGEHVPVPLQKTDLSTWSSQSALAVGTSMDSSPSDSNPQYPYVVNGAAIFLDRGAAADIWLVETPESKYILKVLRLNLAYFSMSHTKKNSHGGTNRQDAPAQQFTQHFRSKAGAWSSLQHQNVIMVFGLGERLDLRVEFCENGTARKYLERHNNDIIRKKLMIQHILEGMNYLHSQSPPIVHGCLRADKVFVTADGTAKIGEFGLSFLTRGFALHAPSISQAGLSRWMSPELVDIDPDTGTIIQTTASDVWALACTLLEIISGEIPYTRYKHEIKVRKAIIKGEQPGTIGYDDRNNFRILSPILTECWDMSPNKRPPVSRVRLLADPPIASAPSSPKFSWTSWSNFGSPSKVDSGPRPPDDITPLPSLYPESKTDEPENTQAIRKTDRYQRLSGQASSPEGSAPMTVQSFDATHSTNMKEQQTEVQSRVNHRRCDRCLRRNMRCTFDPPNATRCQGCSSIGKNCIVSVDQGTVGGTLIPLTPPTPDLPFPPSPSGL